MKRKNGKRSRPFFPSLSVSSLMNKNAHIFPAFLQVSPDSSIEYDCCITDRERRKKKHPNVFICGLDGDPNEQQPCVA